MTAKETFTRVNLGAFMGLPWENLRVCLLKSRVVELKAYCPDKLPPACKKEELIETILNYRDMGLINLKVMLQLAPLFLIMGGYLLPENLYNENSLGFLYMNRSPLIGARKHACYLTSHLCTFIHT